MVPGMFPPLLIRVGFVTAVTHPRDCPDSRLLMSHDCRDSSIHDSSASGSGPGSDSGLYMSVLLVADMIVVSLDEYLSVHE